MARQTARQKLNLLDQYLHALLKRFYLRSFPNGPGAELSESESFACNLVGRMVKCTMTELANECGLALSSMTGIVDRLVAKKCVRRARDVDDRRKVYVELDKKGEQIYQQHLEAEMEMIITMMDALEPEEQDALLQTLGKAVGSLGK